MLSLSQDAANICSFSSALQDLFSQLGHDIRAAYHTLGFSELQLKGRAMLVESLRF